MLVNLFSEVWCGVCSAGGLWGFLGARGSAYGLGGWVVGARWLDLVGFRGGA